MEPAISSDMTRETTHQYRSEYQSVAPSVGPMKAQRLAYDDLSTPAEMGADCLAVQAALTRPLAAAARDLAREQTKTGGVEVPEAAARLARALNLQLDGE